MVAFSTLLSETADRVDGLLVLAFVPFVVSLVSPDDFRKVATSGADWPDER